MNKLLSQRVFTAYLFSSLLIGAGSIVLFGAGCLGTHYVDYSNVPVILSTDKGDVDCRNPKGAEEQTSCDDLFEKMGPELFR